MKLYTIYSKTHTALYQEFFLPSVERFGEGLEVCAEEWAQDGNGAYMDAGWVRYTWEKVRLLLRGVRENPGRLFLYSDCDVQWFRPIGVELAGLAEGVDVLAQEDMPGNICAGFMVLRGTEKVQKWLEQALMWGKFYEYDQWALNEFRNMVGYRLLDPRRYWTLRIEDDRWDESMPAVPEEMVMHHGNFVVGMERKVKLMRMVRELVKGRGGG